MHKIYDEIGVGYSTGRHPDPRIAEFISRALGGAMTLINVGAGSGSYEPSEKVVVAVEPSATMIRQRPAKSGPSVQAVAEALPFRDGAFDCAMAVMTIHHWADPVAGISEMRRVARERVVILTWDQNVWEQFWLLADYLPGLGQFIRRRSVAVSGITSALGKCQVLPVPIPHDCVDGFLGAFWSRPAAYLNPEIRARMSAFAQVSPDECESGLETLAGDIGDGSWLAKYGSLLEANTIDLGYRLIVSDSR